MPSPTRFILTLTLTASFACARKTPPSGCEAAIANLFARCPATEICPQGTEVCRPEHLDRCRGDLKLPDNACFVRTLSCAAAAPDCAAVKACFDNGC